MQIGELCRRLGVPYRHARYVLEQGIVPPGVEASPDRGNHRLLDSAQAFWLAIVLKLKQSGISAQLGGRIADFAREGVNAVARTIAWEPSFAPFEGHLETTARWFVDIGDLKYVRVATDAPGEAGRLMEFGWIILGAHRKASEVPFVTLRLDLSKIAAQLRDGQRGRSVLD